MPAKFVLLATFLLLGRLTARASADDAPRPHPQMGVNAHFGLGGDYISYYRVEELMPKLAELGVGWVRDSVNWRAVEPKKGEYQVPARTREWIDAAHRAGLHVVLLLNFGNKLYADEYDPEAYATAAAFLARQLEGKVQALEILNEPNNFDYRKYYGGVWNGFEKDGRTSPWVGKYVTLLNTAAKAVKAANPAMKVIGLGSPPPVNFRQIAMGIAPEVDGIVDHPYSYRTIPELLSFPDTPANFARDGIVTADEAGTFASQTRLYRELAKKHRGPRELWHTEWGFPNHYDAKPGVMYSGRTEEAAAKYMLRRFVESLAIGVDVSFYYDLKNDGRSLHDPEHNFGLLTFDNQPKPAFAALRRLTQVMLPYRPAPRPLKVTVTTRSSRTDPYPITWDGSRLVAPDGLAIHQFENRQGKAAVFLWSMERVGGDLQPRLVDVEIRAAQPVLGVNILDLFTGGTSAPAFKHENGVLSLTNLPVPAHPVVLTFHSTP